MARQTSPRREKISSTSPWNRSSVLLNCLQLFNIPVELEDPNQTQYSCCSFNSMEQVGIVTPLDPMDVLFLVQPGE